MSKKKCSQPTEDFEYWEIVLKFYEGDTREFPVILEDEYGEPTLVPERDQLGRPIPLSFENDLQDENGRLIPHLVLDGVVVRAATSTVIACRSTSSVWWPEISAKVEERSLRMTVSKSVFGGDRIDVDPCMVRYLKWVDQNGVEPIFEGPDGERLYAPRFSILEEVSKPNVSWSNFVHRYLRDKFLDGKLPAGVTPSDVARDLLIRAAETNPDLKDIMCNPQSREDATEALRKEISRQLRIRRETSRGAHLPRNAEKLRISSRPST
jgi:hypothetical protein